MMESIAIYYTPLASTQIASVVGLSIAHHMALVYTDAAGQSYGVSSGPSKQMTAQTPGRALTAIWDSLTNTPSGFGVLLSDPHNNHSFIIGRPEDYYTQDDEGHPYPFNVVLTGRNLSARWATIVKTYVNVGKLHLTYSPITQNSNSMAGTALLSAGIPIPFSSKSYFAPGEFDHLPVATSGDAEAAR